MLPLFVDALDHHPRRLLAALALACLCMLGFGLYLQHAIGLEPCPMCIVQRYADALIVLLAGLGALTRARPLRLAVLALLLLVAVCGAGVAARQSWLQWYPPEVFACGRDLYGMIEAFPLKRVLPMIFKGSGDCSKVDWTLLGGSIANWSFLWFCAAASLSALLFWRQWRRGSAS